MLVRKKISSIFYDCTNFLYFFITRKKEIYFIVGIKFFSKVFLSFSVSYFIIHSLSSQFSALYLCFKSYNTIISSADTHNFFLFYFTFYIHPENEKESAKNGILRRIAREKKSITRDLLFLLAEFTHTYILAYDGSSKKRKN
jgi:hypothetical protein